MFCEKLGCGLSRIFASTQHFLDLQRQTRRNSLTQTPSNSAPNPALARVVAGVDSADKAASKVLRTKQLTAQVERSIGAMVCFFVVISVYFSDQPLKTAGIDLSLWLKTPSTAKWLWRKFAIGGMNAL